MNSEIFNPGDQVEFTDNLLDSKGRIRIKKGAKGVLFSVMVKPYGTVGVKIPGRYYDANNVPVEILKKI